ncbi:MAG: redoxin domain-containing protein [Syntrophales bacterium]|nr:redoxin domain-containing protein [Syntrophales bacterium]
MKRILIHVIVIAVFSLIITLPVSAATQPPATGSVLPEIKLTVPANNDYKNYLGLSRGDFFKIPQIKANVVIIEIMNMYCPHCQASAHKVNELYRIIENNPALKNKIKLIGIAAGNSTYEAEVFRKRYDVPFPLFEDGDFSIHKVVGEVRTPYFIGIRIDDGVPKVFYSKLGGFEKADQFLELLLKLSGLK